VEVTHFCPQVLRLLQGMSIGGTWTESYRKEHHRPDLLAEENWRVLKSCVVSATEEAVSQRIRKQPEWFVESAEELTPLLRRKNEAQERLIVTKSSKQGESLASSGW